MSFIEPFWTWIWAIALAIASLAQSEPPPELPRVQVDQVADQVAADPAPTNEFSNERYPCWTLKGDLTVADLPGYHGHMQGTPPGWHLMVLNANGEEYTNSFTLLTADPVKPTVPDLPEC